jgi:hypothetical protein
MKNLLRRSFALTIIGLLVVLSGVPSDAARRGAVRSAYEPMTGRGAWQSTPSVGAAARFAPLFRLSVAASTQQTKVTEPTARSAKVVRSALPLRAAASPRRDPEGCHTIPAPVDGGRLEESAPVVGQPRGAQSITEITIWLQQMCQRPA